VPCQCPPAPHEWTNHVLKWLIYFFTVEWSARVLLFEPPIPLLDRDRSYSQNQPTPSYWRLWFAHLTDPTTVLDALAIFPFYLESIDSVNGLMSLRLLRLFRVFQLVRLGQYNTTFMSLTNVMYQAGLYLRLLMIVLVFGAALFGSLMYWLEKGTWQYHDDSESYRFMRIGVDGVTLEPSPFTSIPVAFWWFMVTATTVGYG
jgi:voltage-gated potassium channel